MTDPLGLVEAVRLAEAARARPEPRRVAALSCAVAHSLARADLAGRLLVRWVGADLERSGAGAVAAAEDGVVGLARWVLERATRSLAHAEHAGPGEGRPRPVETPDGPCAPEQRAFAEDLVRAVGPPEPLIVMALSRAFGRGQRDAAVGAEAAGRASFAARRPRSSGAITVPGWRIGWEYRTRRDQKVRRGRPEDHGENHKALDGISAPHDDVVWRRFTPPCGFACFPGDTVVRGPALYASRMLYDGEVVEVLTQSGARLTLTPNHRVPTADGWIDAGAIAKGQHLLCDAREDDRTPLGPSDQIHEDHEPAEAEQVFRALAELHGVTRLRRSRDDFDGDAERGFGEVEVVAADRELLLELHAQHRERVVDPRLVVVATKSTAQVASASRGSELLLRLGSAGGRSPGFAALALADPSVVGPGLPLRPLEHLGGVSSSWLYGAGDQAAADLLPLDAEAFRQRLLRSAGHVKIHARGAVEPEAARLEPRGRRPSSVQRQVSGSDELVGHQVGVADELGQAVEGRTQAVAFDEVTQVHRRSFTGHVYDLQTPTGMIVANGIYISNCRCVLLVVRFGPWTDDALATALERGAAAAPGFGAP